MYFELLADMLAIQCAKQKSEKKFEKIHYV